MQRLPNVHPANTILYPNGTGFFAVGAANEGSKILFYNATQLTLQLDFLNGHSDTLHPWEANYWELDGDTKQIQWLIDTDSLNVTTPPLSAVFLTLYGPDEKISGTYPVSLPYQTSLGGGSTNTTVTSTNTLSNTGNPVVTNVITIQSSDAASAEILIYNDGSCTWKTSNGSGTLTQLLQMIAGASPKLLLAATSILTEIAGTFQVDQSSTFTGQVVINQSGVGLNVANGSGTFAAGITNNGGLSQNGDITLQSTKSLKVGTTSVLDLSSGVNLFVNPVTTAGTVNIATNGATAVTWDTSQNQTNNGIITANKFNLAVAGGGQFNGISGSWSRISTGTYTSSTSAKTVNHGLGGAPTNVMITGGVSTGSSTAGADTYGATTFTVIDGFAGVTQRFRAERA